jgi:hypothetical protein
MPDPTRACLTQRSGTAGRPLSKEVACQSREFYCSAAPLAPCLVMRMQSPKTCAKSGDICDIDGCALAKRTYQPSHWRHETIRGRPTSSVTSIGPGMLRTQSKMISARAKTRGDIHQKSANDRRDFESRTYIYDLTITHLCGACQVESPSVNIKSSDARTIKTARTCTNLHSVDILRAGLAEG